MSRLLRLAAMPAMTTMENVLWRLKETGDSRHPEHASFDFKRACRLFGFDDYRALQARWEKLD